MNVQIIDIFAVHGDGGEHGRGPIEGYCRTRSEADTMSKGRGWFGGAGAVTGVKALIVGDQMYALAQAAPILFMDAVAQQKADAEAARAAALAKLTPAERALLGLS